MAPEYTSYHWACISKGERWRGIFFPLFTALRKLHELHKNKVYCSWPLKLLYFGFGHTSKYEEKLWKNIDRYHDASVCVEIAILAILKTDVTFIIEVSLRFRNLWNQYFDYYNLSLPDLSTEETNWCHQKNRSITLNEPGIYFFSDCNECCIFVYRLITICKLFLWKTNPPVTAAFQKTYLNCTKWIHYIYVK